MDKISDEVLRGIARLIGNVKTGEEITQLFHDAGYPEIIHDGSTKWRFVYKVFQSFKEKRKFDDIKRVIEKFADPKQYIGREILHSKVIDELNKILSYDGFKIDEKNYKVTPITAQESNQFMREKEKAIGLISAILGAVMGRKSMEKLFPAFFSKRKDLEFADKPRKIEAILSEAKSKEEFKITLQAIINVHENYFTNKKRIEQFNVILEPLGLRLNDDLTIYELSSDLVAELENISREISESILSEILPADIIEKGKKMAEAYTFLYCIENSLRILIEKKLTQDYGPDFLKRINIPRETIEKVKKRKIEEEKNKWIPTRGSSDIFYMDFRDLGKIIQTNWSSFKDVFPDQQWILSKINEIAQIRNLIAHNSYIKEDERGLLKLYYRQILKQVENKL